MIAFLALRHVYEHVTVMLHGFVARASQAAIRIREYEFATFVVGVAASFVAFEAGLRSDFGPDFAGKEIINVRGASGSAVAFLFLAIRFSCKPRQRNEHESNEASEHEWLYRQGRAH